MKLQPVIHHIEYMPSGEQFSEQRDNWATPYKFNSKELDAETGLYYYGARYYTPEIGIWLSVDPMSDKYPSLSPFAYCANNPVILVDPDGRDIWEFDDCGNYIGVTKDKKIDQFRVVQIDDKGNKTTIAESEKFKKGTVKHNQPMISDGNNVTKLDVFSINGDENAKQVFEMFADNTVVEWTHAKTGKEGSGKNIVGTSHNETSTAVGAYLRETGYHLKEVNHNHSFYGVPEGVNDYLPSGISKYDKNGNRTGDCRGAELYYEKNSNIKLHTYTKSRGYTQYDKLGVIIK